MRGWTPTGAAVDLTELQSSAVRSLLAWARGSAVHMPSLGIDGGQAGIIATALACLAGELMPATSAEGPPEAPFDSARFRKDLIAAMADPGVARAVHQAVAQIQLRRNSANSGKGPAAAGRKAST